MKFKKYFVVAKQEVKERFSHLWDKFFTILTFWLILFVFLNLWIAVYGGKEQVLGFTLLQLFWYFTLAEVIVFSSPGETIEKIGEEVRSGTISQYLLKPFNYCLAKGSRFLAAFILNFALIGAGGIFFTFLFIGPIDLTFMGISLTGLTIIIGVALNFIIVLTLGLTAFWTEDSTSISWIYQKIVFIIGGMLIPLEFYPEWLSQIAKILPTAYFMYYPSKLFVHFNFELFLKVLAGQIIWIIILTAILFLIYKKSVKEVNINGG